MNQFHSEARRNSGIHHNTNASGGAGRAVAGVVSPPSSPLEPLQPTFGRGRGLLAAVGEPVVGGGGGQSSLAPRPLRRPHAAAAVPTPGTASFSPPPPLPQQRQQAIFGSSVSPPSPHAVVGGGGDGRAASIRLPLSRLVEQDTSFGSVDRLATDLSLQHLSPGGAGDTAVSVSGGGGSGLNPYSGEFVPAAQRACSAVVAPVWAGGDAQLTGGDVTSYSAGQRVTSPDVETSEAFFHHVFTEMPEPTTEFQRTLYSNVCLLLHTISSDPAIYESLAPIFLNYMVDWSRNETINNHLLVSFLLNQVAIEPKFRYTCAKLCQLLCVKLPSSQPSFRDVLMQRCQHLFGVFEQLSSAGSGPAPADMIGCCGQLLLLLCELAVRVKVNSDEAGVGGCHVAALLVAVQRAVDCMMLQLSETRVHYALLALKMVWVQLAAYSQCHVADTWTRVATASADPRLSPQLRQQLRQLRLSASTAAAENSTAAAGRDNNNTDRYSTNNARLSNGVMNGHLSTSSCERSDSGTVSPTDYSQYLAEMTQFVADMEKEAAIIDSGGVSGGVRTGGSGGARLQHELHYELADNDDEVDAAYEVFLANMHNH